MTPSETKEHVRDIAVSVIGTLICEAEAWDAIEPVHNIYYNVKFETFQCLIELSNEYGAELNCSINYETGVIEVTRDGTEEVLGTFKLQLTKIVKVVPDLYVIDDLETEENAYVKPTED